MNTLEKVVISLHKNAVYELMLDSRDDLHSTPVSISLLQHMMTVTNESSTNKKKDYT